MPFVKDKIDLHANSETFDPTKCIQPELKAEITTQTARYFDVFSPKSIWILIQSYK
jgi:hypothetical protein